VFAFEERPFWANCEKFAPHPRIDADNFGRYSNTLLVSLNSRIAIRREDNPRVSTLSPSIAFDITSHLAGSPTNITLKDTGIEQPEAVYKPSDSVAI
jgi:hypothetical protein